MSAGTSDFRRFQKLLGKKHRDGDKVSDKTIGSYMREMGLGSVRGTIVPRQQQVKISAVSKKYVHLLLEELMVRIHEIREEMADALDDLKNMMAKSREMRPY